MINRIKYVGIIKWLINNKLFNNYAIHIELIR